MRKERNKNLPELLVPAGGKEQFETACIYGADAIYLGGDGLNLRKMSHGFTQEELCQSVKHAHESQIEVFYCLNALPFNEQIPLVKERLEQLADTKKEEQVDALIIADPGVFLLAREICPEIPIHVSTQAHTTNIESIRFWQKLGATRVNLARETNFKNIKEMTSALPDMECEVFMHGAMCLALSGHCLLSMWSNNRVANHGGCSQPCRFDYKAKEIRKNESTLHLAHRGNPDEVLWIAEENEELSTIWSPHEHCLIRYMSYLKQIGVASLKIEGRTKSPSYVAQVTDIYRTALDRTLLTAEEKKNLPYSLNDLIQDLASVATRPLSTGFFLPERRVEALPIKQNKKIVARVLEKLSDSSWLLDVRAPLHEGKNIQVLVPGYQRPHLSEYTLENHKGEKVTQIHPGMKGVIHCESKYLQEKLYIQTID